MKFGKVLFALIFAVFLFVSAHGCCCCCPCCCCRRRHYLRHQYRQLQHHGGHHQGVLPPVHAHAAGDTVLRGKLATEAPRTEAAETPKREQQKDQVGNKGKKTTDTNTDRREQ